MINSSIIKHTLANGLTLIIRPTHTVPKVSLQLWYNVGSKDEKTSEKGLAHLLEHMIFKGTHSLSESDINRITHKLSATTNAFTSYDFTGYLFDCPSHHYEEFIGILADCMSNCRFETDHLASEMKAVIQELKLYKDRHIGMLIQHMMSSMFADHPYHYPVIGFKHDLWNITQHHLMNFYKQHYIPNNATLVVVGDVDPKAVVALVEEKFGSIAPNFNYTKTKHHHTPELLAITTTLYESVQQAELLYAFVLPEACLAQDFMLEMLPHLLSQSKESRLYKRLVEELHLATSVTSFSYDLFDHSVFFIHIIPKDVHSIQTVEHELTTMLNQCADQGFTDQEITRAYNQTRTALLRTLQDTHQQAYMIGKGYLETKSEQYLFDMINYTNTLLKDDIHQFMHHHMRSFMMHKGSIMPLQEEQKQYAAQLQALSDQQDQRVLCAIKRDSTILQATKVHEIIVGKPKPFAFPHARQFTTQQGLRVLYHHTATIPMICIIIDLHAKSWFDQEEHQGLYTLLCEMMQEGTRDYPGSLLLSVLEDNGMQLSIKPGSITLTVLSEDFEKGLVLLNQLLVHAVLPQKELARIKSTLKSSLQHFWDTPHQFIGQLAREAVYKNNPYHKNAWGSERSIDVIQHADIVDAYQRYIVPERAIMSVVGDITAYDLTALITTHLKDWHGAALKAPDFGDIVIPQTNEQIVYPIARDQVVLAFCTPSVARTDPRYDALMVYDQILTGGALNSLHSKLFSLREQSGLFYTIGGSLLTHADQHPGMMFIKTIVSLDRLDEAKQAIERVLHDVSCDESALQEAVRALSTSLVQHFESHEAIAHSFIFLERYGFASDYFDKRTQHLAQITKEQVLKVVKECMQQPHYTIMAGRL